MMKPLTAMSSRRPSKRALKLLARVKPFERWVAETNANAEAQDVYRLVVKGLREAGGLE